MAVNAKMPTFAWRMNVSAANQSVGEIWIYDDISAYESWWDEDAITPKKFKDDLDALGDVSLIKVYINSNGGDVFAGQAIHTMLSRHKAEVHVYIDGLAASIASVIAMAGDKVIMPVNAQLMIHNPWTMIWDWIAGNADYFREMADKMTKMAKDLDVIRESLIAAYMKRATCTREELIAMLDEETWLPAERCKELGFCDEIEGAKQIAASLRGNVLAMNGRTFDLSRFQHRPQNLVEEPVADDERPDDSDPGEQAKDDTSTLPPASGGVIEGSSPIGGEDGAVLPPDMKAFMSTTTETLKTLTEALAEMRAAFSVAPKENPAASTVKSAVTQPAGEVGEDVLVIGDEEPLLIIEDAPQEEVNIEAETLHQTIKAAVDDGMKEIRLRMTGRVD